MQGPSSAFNVVRRFPGLKALVVGDAILDSYYEGTADRIAREGPVPVIRRRGAAEAPGGAANTAANLAALGAEVRLVALAGDDEPGRSLSAVLARAGVSDRWLVRDPGCATLHKLRIVADGQYLVRFDEGETLDRSPQAEAQLLRAASGAFADADLIVCSDYGEGVLSGAMIAMLGDLRRERPCVMVVDPRQPLRYAAAAATLIAPDLDAALRAAALERQRGEEPAAAAGRAAARLRELVDAEHIAVTAGGDGVVLAGTSSVTHLAARRVPRAGDVGAGDTFTAATALALACGASADLAARIGMDAAAIAVTRPRTAIVSHRELLSRASLDETRAPMSLKDVAAAVDRERFAGKRIVFTNGVFDMLHAGHVHLLQRAKGLGEILVVGINSDASTRRLKGPTRPINPEADRLALLLALESVDYALIFDDDTATEAIRALRPDIHVKGGDYSPDTLPERAAVEEIGGRIEILPLVEGRSTTGAIQRIAAALPPAPEA